MVSASISGVPAPKVIWYKDGITLLSAPYCTIETGDNATKISFTNVPVDANGNYRCVVENDFGSGSAEFNLKVRGIDYRT